MRADNLKVVYGFDNTAFIKDLSQRGFYVANCSQSNYAYTELSLASSLNANYLDVLGASHDAQADSLIQDSSVRLFLKTVGIRLSLLKRVLPGPNGKMRMFIINMCHTRTS